MEFWNFRSNMFSISEGWTQWISRSDRRFENDELPGVVTSRRRGHWLLVAGVCVFLLVGVVPSRSATARSDDDMTAGDFLTTENSSDLDRDCRAIESYCCSVWVNWRGETGSVEGELCPDEAQSAHAFLRKLLTQFPLRRDCYFASRHFSIASDQGIAFRSPHRGRGAVFVLRLYPGNHMELEYNPTNESEETSIGATFDLTSEIEPRYYSVLAECLANTEPHLAGEYRRKATVIWLSAFAPYLLLLAVLAAIAIVPVVLFWGSRNPKTKSSDLSDPSEPKQSSSCGSQDAGRATDEPPDR